MALDPDLVRDAEAARARLRDAQHAAERARADYHHAVRRLHERGGSLREVAEALRLSHQRVHQIVGALDEGPVGPCSFCGCSREECEKLIAGPGVFICERCVARASGLAGGAPADDHDRAEPGMLVEPPGSEAQCSFCGLEARKVRRLVASRLSVRAGKFGDLPRICDKCLTLCEEILADTTRSRPPADDW
jgi:ClpX C4-type zinc finger